MDTVKPREQARSLRTGYNFRTLRLSNLVIRSFLATFQETSMFSAKRIVVGVEMPESRPWDAANLAPPSRLAVRQAFEVAEAMNSAVEMVCVLEEASAGFFESEDDAKAEDARDRTEAAAVLADLAQQYLAKSRRPIDVIQTIAFGRPWLEILKAAGSARDNLIMCGTRDQGAISRLLFGNTGLKLLRNAACPVWLVKPRIDDDADLDVLAATDLGEIGEDVLHAGVALGQRLPVRLNVIHVVDNEGERRVARMVAAPNEFAAHRAKAIEDAEQTLHQQLDKTDYRTVGKGVQVHVEVGIADECILNALTELDIDLLIMATAGRDGIPGMLFGNTAERLLPVLPCSILAIKPDNFVCPVEL